ncbi:hypothetical protein cypCar_00007189 [Cyprinus carpio]|nr:hypothetical protein cypCar_00007189 [Cyprinus carpio]
MASSHCLLLPRQMFDRPSSGWTLGTGKARAFYLSGSEGTDFDQSNMSERFDCDNCKESLYGRKYIQAEDNPYCIPCYDSLFANTCDECKELIGHDSRTGLKSSPIALWHRSFSLFSILLCKTASLHTSETDSMSRPQVCSSIFYCETAAQASVATLWNN